MEKAPILARDPRRWNQATGPISATICSVLEPGWKPSTPGFWQTPSYSGQAQIIDSFFQDMEMQTWKRAAGHSLSAGMEKRYHHRLCQEGQVSADQRGKIHGCTCAGLSCFWSHQRTSLACRWIYSQPTFLCTLRSESLGHQEAPDEVWLPTVLVPACTRRTGRTPQFVAADLAWASSKLICFCFRRARASSSCFLSLRNCLRSFLMSGLSSSSCFSSWAANSASFSFVDFSFGTVLTAFVPRVSFFLLVSRPIHGILEKLLFHS